MKSLLRTTGLILLTSGSLVFAAYLYLGTIIERVIFRPEPLEPDHTYEFAYDFKELTLYPEKDAAINALYFKHPNPKGVILYFHGNVGNLDRWGDVAGELTHFGYDVFIMDYRGYGKSEGIRSENAMYQDALYCYNYVMENYKPAKTVIYGRSLGTGVASWLAGHVSYDRLILETPFYSMSEMVSRYVPPAIVNRHLEYTFNSAEHLQCAERDILILHGTRDKTVPYESGRRLFDSIPHSNAQLVTFKGAGHNKLSSYPKYWDSVGQFLAFGAKGEE